MRTASNESPVDVSVLDYSELIYALKSKGFEFTMTDSVLLYLWGNWDCGFKEDRRQRGDETPREWLRRCLMEVHRCYANHE